MENMTLKISEKTNDLEFDNDGILRTVEGEETTAQNVRMALTAWKGDFPLVQEHGTDYKKAFSENCLDDEREEILREAVLQEEDVKQIEKMEMKSSGERSISALFTGIMKNGSEISMEVGKTWQGKNGD